MSGPGGFRKSVWVIFCAWFLLGASCAMAMPLRVLYAPGHFGNSYEVMGAREMRAVLAEAQHWGFNHYADWFDTIDCADPFSDPHYNLAGVLWDRKKAHFKTAQDLGLGCHLVITPNHVFLDQCTPDVAAVKGGRLFGQLVCPSKNSGRAIILKNYESLFADLAASGVGLSGLWACPYDYGGCACETCKPWILTFARLSREIHALAQKQHPEVAMHFIGWWWSAEEHARFAEWANSQAPGWAKSIALHIPYDKTDVSDVPLPKDCERQAFVHIGYAEEATPRDVYGHLGPVIAAARLEETVARLKAHGCTGVMAYSEGVFDDVNKALLAGLSAGTYADSEGILRAYAERYFQPPPEAIPAWTKWLTAWGRPFDVDAASAAQVLDNLEQGGTGIWRFRQWRLKAELMRLNSEIGNETEWPQKRLATVDEFWAIQERLQREVWGLGPLRHVMARPSTPTPWYKAWRQYVREEAQAVPGT